METKVSVIVPVHNCKKYLDECLTSLAHQTLKEIEVIIIDDGSTDNSVAIERQYEERCENFHVYEQEDLSQANAVNRGYTLAQGEYICEVDSDDFVSFRFCEELYNTAKKHDADYVKCGYIGFWGRGQQQENPVIQSELCDVVINPITLPRAEIPTVFGRMISLFTCMVKRSLIIHNGLFWREGVNFEDTSQEWRIRMASDRIVFVDECLYYYRQDNPGRGNKTIKDMYAICDQMQNIIIHAEKCSQALVDYANTFRFYEYEWNLSRIEDKSQREEFYKRAEDDFFKNPAPKEFFNTENDWLKYNIIRSGLWRQL